MATLNLAKNTQFKISDMGMSPVFTQVTGVTNVTWSGKTWATEDVTNHDDATPVKKMVPTIYDNGKYTLTYTYDPNNTQHAAIKTLSASGVPNDFQVIEVASGGTNAFSGYITSYQEVTPVNGLMTVKADVLIFGAFD